MTRQRAKELLPVIQAYADGKTVQYKREIGGEWSDDAGCNADINLDVFPFIWRIKPGPKLRPWKREEVPVGAILRSKGMRSRPMLLVGISNSDGIQFVGGATDVIEVSCDVAEGSLEHSTDGGKTWLPCGVME
jgi:hypothetical protein